MNQNNKAIRFLYGTKPGRLLLRGIMLTRADRLAANFLWTKYSRPLIGRYAKHHGIPLEKDHHYGSFRDFFVRTREPLPFDPEPSHLISPCDGWLSAYPVQPDSSFAIKNSLYRLQDILQDEELSRKYHGGDCLIFRLCASDYHHYCYIDDGYQGENHMIPGVLHSVQPLACEIYPVYTLNRRCWTLLTTEHFGPVVQTEIGALIVGGIFNGRHNCRFVKGSEKGHFELAGSTIVLLFEEGRIKLLPELEEIIRRDGEARVEQGMWIGTGLSAPRGDRQ